jgi:hypothetical protein
MEVGKGLVYPY